MINLPTVSLSSTGEYISPTSSKLRCGVLEVNGVYLVAVDSPIDREVIAYGCYRDLDSAAMAANMICQLLICRNMCDDKWRDQLKLGRFRLTETLEHREFLDRLERIVNAYSPAAGLSAADVTSAADYVKRQRSGGAY